MKMSATLLPHHGDRLLWNHFVTATARCPPTRSVRLAGLRRGRFIARRVVWNGTVGMRVSSGGSPPPGRTHGRVPGSFWLRRCGYIWGPVPGAQSLAMTQPVVDRGPEGVLVVLYSLMLCPLQKHTPSIGPPFGAASAARPLRPANRQEEAERRPV